jgi:hypothetical protein
LRKGEWNTCRRICLPAALNAGVERAAAEIVYTSIEHDSAGR